MNNSESWLNHSESWRDYREDYPHLRPQWDIFIAARTRARHRKYPVAWEMTFFEWLEVWGDQYHEKKSVDNPDGLVMGRIADHGPYRKDNVYICSNADNSRIQIMLRAFNAANEGRVIRDAAGKFQLTKTATMSDAFVLMEVELNGIELPEVFA